jgi:hypothetical protein
MRVVRDSGPHVALALRAALALALVPRLWSLTQPAVHHERPDALKATRAYNLLKQNVFTFCFNAIMEKKSP